MEVKYRQFDQSWLRKQHFTFCGVHFKATTLSRRYETSDKTCTVRNGVPSSPNAQCLCSQRSDSTRQKAVFLFLRVCVCMCVCVYLCVCVCVCYSVCHVQLFVTSWTVAHQIPLSIEFSRQKYWSGLPFPSPGDLPNQRIKPTSPALQADSFLSEPPGSQRAI